MQKTIQPREELLSKYVLQTCNTFSFVNDDLLLRFSDQLNDDEYLLFDYLCFQGLTIQEATKKIEFCSSKVYNLITKIKSKGLSFFESDTNVMLNKDRLVHNNYSLNTSLSYVA